MQDDDTHIYYNALFSNTSNVIKAAYFEEVRTSPIIKDPSQYHCAVIRFTIPTFNIPLFTFPQNPDGTPNNQYFRFTIRFNNVNYIGYVIFSPWSSVTGTNIYNYQNFVDMLNTTLYNLYLTIAAADITFTAVTPPYFTLNSEANIIYLNCDLFYINTIIYINYPLLKFFEPMPHVFYSTNNINGLDASFIIEKSGDNMTPITPPIGTYVNPPDGLYMQSEWPVLQDWQTLKSILITSNSIHTRGEFVQNNTTINADSTLNILTDFEPSKTSPGSSKSWLQYFADIYRYIDIRTNEPIRYIDLQIFYSDTFGVIRPLYINPGDYFSVKIMFSKKTNQY